MMKCDMCYDRTSIGKKPMCATVCPSGALTFTTREHRTDAPGRRDSRVAVRRETVRTKVNVLVPRSVQRIDVSIEQIGMTTTDEYDVANLLMETRCLKKKTNSRTAAWNAKRRNMPAGVRTFP